MKLLVAEDDRKMAQLMRKGLKKNAHSVDVAYDGQKALNLLNRSDYDVVLLDVMMSQLDGLEVCRQMREKRIETPVIMLSARHAVPDRVRGLDIGADDFLPKPFSLVELDARIRAAFRRKNPYTLPILEVGDLVMDTNRRMVFRSGKPIELSAREYQILEYLMRHPGQVMTREQIVDAVWGMERMVFSNAVDVHVSHLRQKVDQGAEKPMLRTIRGQGYVLDLPVAEEDEG